MVGRGGEGVSEGGCIGEGVVWVNSFCGLKKKLKVALKKTIFGDTFLMRARLGKGSTLPKLKSETVHY